MRGGQRGGQGWQGQVHKEGKVMETDTFLAKYDFCIDNCGQEGKVRGARVNTGCVRAARVCVP